MKSMQSENTPIVALMHGLPGAGKSAFARQFAEKHGWSHLQADFLRYSLYDDPHYDTAKNRVLYDLMNHELRLLLEHGINVLYDFHLPTIKLRKALREAVEKMGGEVIIFWIQTDPETAALRSAQRDRRKVDDRYNFAMSEQQFQDIARSVRPPSQEPTVVISGKHHFKNQTMSVERALYQKTGMKLMKKLDIDVTGRFDPIRRMNPRSQPRV
jgi:predicted kinase